MTDRDALYRSILANPEDDVVRWVYADFIREQGENDRADFIECQLRIAELVASGTHERWSCSVRGPCSECTREHDSVDYCKSREIYGLRETEMRLWRNLKNWIKAEFPETEFSDRNDYGPLPRVRDNRGCYVLVRGFPGICQYQLLEWWLERGRRSGRSIVRRHPITSVYFSNVGFDGLDGLILVRRALSGPGDMAGYEFNRAGFLNLQEYYGLPTRLRDSFAEGGEDAFKLARTMLSNVLLARARRR